MGVEFHKQIKWEILVFDKKNHEGKSSKYFGRTCNSSLVVCLCQFIVRFLILALEIVRIMLFSTCEETTVRVAVLSSTV